MAHSLPKGGGWSRVVPSIRPHSHHFVLYLALLLASLSGGVLVSVFLLWPFCLGLFFALAPCWVSKLNLLPGGV